MRFWFLVFMVMAALVVVSYSGSATAKKNNKYAALMMDADTGEILSHENGYAKRYPASLTKMMTLYMVFDALRKDEISLRTRMRASKNAAAQPQTNVSLKTGDTIRVEDAIRALVVRSANDVAVVVAEHLGRTEWNFSVKMTKMAKELGMKHTVFRNAHGLPDSRQHTTAYDMALLGKALKRDFPQYYHYFSTKQFSFKGRTYKTHNNVLKKYDGVDGIKTGYIRASGFNLVTSVKQDGSNIIGVVLGGTSAKKRDYQMMALLDRTFIGLARHRNTPKMIASAPIPSLNPKRAAIERIAALNKSQEDIKVSDTIELASVAETKEASSISIPMPKAKPPIFSFSLRDTIEAKDIKEDKKTARDNTPSFSFKIDTESKANAAKPEKNTLEYQLAMLNQSNIVQNNVIRSSKDWGVQVGAFRKEHHARAAVKKVFSLVGNQIQDAYVSISSGNKRSGSFHRARLGNMSETQANDVCQTLIAMDEKCFPLRIN